MFLKVHLLNLFCTLYLLAALATLAALAANNAINSSIGVTSNRLADLVDRVEASVHDLASSACKSIYTVLGSHE